MNVEERQQKAVSNWANNRRRPRKLEIVGYSLFAVLSAFIGVLFMRETHWAKAAGMFLVSFADVWIVLRLMKRIRAIADRA